MYSFDSPASSYDFLQIVQRNHAKQEALYFCSIFALARHFSHFPYKPDVTQLTCTKKYLL